MAVTYRATARRHHHARQPAGQLLRPRRWCASSARPSTRRRGRAARVVVMRSASERFFCAGADIKAFLANDVDANMEMIRAAHAALGRIAVARQAFIARIAGHALGGGLEIALACDLRYARAGEHRLGHARGDARAAARQRRHPAPPRLIGRGRALELLLTGRTVTPDEAQRWASSAAVFADEASVRRARRAARRRARRWRSPRSSAASTRAGSGRSSDGLELERGADRAAVPLQGRQRGPDGLRREARAGVHGRMSTVVAGGARSAARSSTAPSSRSATTPVTQSAIPATGAEVGRVRSAGAARSTAPCAPRRRAFGAWSRRGHTDRGAILHAGAEALLEARRRAACPGWSPSRARRCARRSSSCTRRPTRSSTTPAWPRRCAASTSTALDPGVEGRVLRRPLGVVGGDRAVELPHHAAEQQARPRAAVRQHGGGQARRHDAVHHAAPRRDPARGAGSRPASSTSSPGAAPVAGRRSSATRSCARSPSRARRRSGEQVAALAAEGTKRVTLELGGSDPMIICDDADLAKAASAASMGRFYNCGQACLAIKRVYVFDVRGRRGGRGDRRQGGPAARRHRTDEGVQIGPLHTERQRDAARGPARATLSAAARSSPAAGARAIRSSPTAGSTSRPSCSSPPRDSPMATEEVFGPGAAHLARARPRRGARARQRLAVRPRVLDVDARPRSRRARRGRARVRLHVDQLADQGLRRAAVRRGQGERLRQGARLEALDHYSDLKSVVVSAGRIA